jgi:hypothetical protein
MAPGVKRSWFHVLICQRLLAEIYCAHAFLSEISFINAAWAGVWLFDPKVRKKIYSRQPFAGSESH